MTSTDVPREPKRCRNAAPAPAPAPAVYAPHTTLTERQLRTLVEAESSQALELARRAGLETP